jgi:hypothetical protein
MLAIDIARAGSRATMRWRVAPRAPIIPRVRDTDSIGAQRLLVEILLDTDGRDGETDWIRATLAGVEVRPDYATVGRPYAAAARRLRELDLAPTSQQQDALNRCGLDALAGRGVVAVFRGALLLTACRYAVGKARAALVERIFRTGDSEERVALLAVLSALPGAPEYAETAVEACRSNVRDVFEAIACENEYPARYFSDPAFNQLVMKALFSGLSLERLRGLSGRLNSELARMARDYGAERRSAGREVPADLSRLLAGRGGV